MLDVLDNKIIDLEIKCSYQEMKIEELNQILISQQGQISALLLRADKMEGLLEKLQGEELEETFNCPPSYVNR